MGQLTPLHRRKFVPQALTSEQARVLISISSGDGDRIALLAKSLEEEFAYKVAVNRLAALKAPVEAQVLIFLIFIVENLGSLSLFVHCIWHIRRENKLAPDQLLPLHDFLMAFADGFPSEQALEEAWAAQKDERGFNIVDRDAEYQ